VVLQKSQRRAVHSVLAARAAWGVAPVAREAWVVRRAGPVVRVVSVALPVAREVLEAVLLVAAMVALAGSAAIHVAVPGHQAVGRAAIDPPVIVRASVVRGPVSAPRDRVVPRQAPRARLAAVIVGRLVLASVNRIARRADLGRVARGRAPAVLAVLVPRGQRLIGLMSPTVPAVVLTAEQPDPRRGGRTPCRRLNSGH
jgi:hypothetical protein